MFKTVSSKLVYEDAWITLHKDEILFPDNTKGTHTVMDRKSGSFVLLYNKKNEVLLVKQYRYPIKAYDWGLPGGGIDKNETPEQGAIREVKEEVGITVQNPVRIGWYYALSSLSTEKIYLFFCSVEDIKPILHGESDEQINKVLVTPIEKALEMIDTNEITDPFTANALQMLYRRLSQ